MGYSRSVRAALPMVLLVFLVCSQPQATVALHTADRVSIERGGDVSAVHASLGEPPFTRAVFARGCYVWRAKGFTLQYPGFTMPGGKGTLSHIIAQATFINSTHLRCAIPPVRTSGNTTISINASMYAPLPPGSKPLCRGWPNCIGPHRFVCNSTLQGGFSCASFEHFALFAPAFSRRPRPFIREITGAMVVQTDKSLRSTELTLSATIGGVLVSGTIRGGQRSKLEFDLRKFAPLLSEKVHITLALGLKLPDGTVLSRMRQFLRAPPPAKGITASTVQVCGITKVAGCCAVAG